MPWKRTKPCRNAGESGCQFWKLWPISEKSGSAQNVPKPPKKQKAHRFLVHLSEDEAILMGTRSRYLGMHLQRLTTWSITFWPTQSQASSTVAGWRIWRNSPQRNLQRGNHTIGWQATKHRRKPHGVELPFFSGALCHLWKRVEGNFLVALQETIQKELV